MKQKIEVDLAPAIALVVIALISRLPYLLHVAADPIVTHSNLFMHIKPGLLPGFDTIEPHTVITSLCFGHRAALDWLSGSIPWWNPYEGVGAPLAAEMQSAALFLPFILMLAFSKGQLFLHLILQCITGLSTYFLLRRLGVSRIAALAGGALFELNGTFVWLRSATYNPIAFLPLLLLGIEQAWTASRFSKTGGWSTISLALAGSLYAGYPESAYIDGLMAALWVITRFCQASAKERLFFSRKILLAVLTGLMLAAPIVLSFLEYLLVANTGPHESSAMAHTKLPLQYIPQILMPYLYGPIFSFKLSPPADLYALWANAGGYLGAAPLFFCLLSLCGRKERALRFTLLLWIIIALAKIFDIRPIADIVNFLPLVKITAFYRYCLPSFELATILLVSLALDDLYHHACSKTRSLVLAILSISLIVLLPQIISGTWLQQLALIAGAKSWTMYSLFSAVAVSAITAVLAIFLPARKLKTILITTLIIAEALGLFLLPAFSAPRKADIKLAGINFLRDNLGLNRFYTLGPIAPNLGSYYGIASINHNDVPVPQRWVDYVGSHLYQSKIPSLFIGYPTDPQAPMQSQPPAQFMRNLPAYEWVGVKYVVAQHNYNSWIDGRPGAAILKCVYQDELMDIYQLPNPRPYFEVLNGSASLAIASRTQLDAYCQTDCKIVRRELFFPGWSATVNGNPTPIDVCGGLFQSINLPKGHCKICFSYFPPNITYATAAFVVGCLILALGLGFVKI